MKTDIVETVRNLYDKNGTWKGIIDMELVRHMEHDGIVVIDGAGSYEQFIDWDGHENQIVE